MAALDGLRIVDFSRFLPAAYASWVAADMGADVVRVEHPRELAKQEAMLGKASDPARAARNRARPSYNRNKRSLAINPGQPASRPVLEKLISQADILIEDYRPGVMAAMGLGAAAMCALNPRLIYLSVSFAGQTGPLSGKAGHDPAALALAGALSRLNGTPVPTLPGLQVADVLTGAHATIAMLLALQSRARSGEGQHVDVAMADACLPLQLVSMGRFDNLDDMPAPGKWHPKGGVWRCADGGYICTTDMEPAYWARFCETVGKPEFIARLHQIDQHEQMHAELEAIFLTRPRDEWFALLSQAGTQVMPVYSAEEALGQPHHLDRGRIQQVPVEGQEPVRQLALPFILPGSPAIAPRAAAAPGAETAEILAELGLSADDQRALADAGAFSTERSKA